MTRFARAHGSKSSNERVPEEATSWAEMKQQLDAKKEEKDNEVRRKEMGKLRDKNYKDFLSQNVAKTPETWAEFGDLPQNEVCKSNANGDIDIKKRKTEEVEYNKSKSRLKKKKDSVSETVSGGFDQQTDIGIQSEEYEDLVKKPKLKKKKKITTEPDQTINKQQENAKINTSGKSMLTGLNGFIPIKSEKLDKVFANDKERIQYEKKLGRRERQKDKIRKIKAAILENADCEATAIIKEKVQIRKQKKFKKVLANKPENYNTKLANESKEKSEVTVANKTIKKNKKNKKPMNSKINTEFVKSEDDPNISNPSEVDIGSKKRSKSKDYRESDKSTDAITNHSTIQPENSRKNKRSKKNSISDPNTKAATPKANEGTSDNNIKSTITDNKLNPPKKEHKLKNAAWTDNHRKKPINQESTTLRLSGGRTIEITLFDGFPVKKEDGERLMQLRKEMISKGVPRSEVQRAIQLERRRAEKALTREKKEVCFNCRRPGHKLTECPDAKVHETEATGICFKCGSTEHTHFECKVVQQQQFKFATCFICREPGHIAKQCPQNARGIYPQGGGCNVCGDVTHLMKDCPQYQAQQEQRAIQVDTIDGANLEALEKPAMAVGKVQQVVKKTKVIKF